MVRARQVGLFQYSAGLGRVLKKCQVAGRFGPNRSVEIFDWVFSVTLFSLRFILIGQVFRVIPDISRYPIPDDFQNLIRYWRKCWVAGGYRVPVGPCWWCQINKITKIIDPCFTF